MKINEHITDYITNHYTEWMSVDTAEQVLHLEGKLIRTECLLYLLQLMENRNMLQLVRDEKQQITHILKAA